VTVQALKENKELGSLKTFSVSFYWAKILKPHLKEVLPKIIPYRCLVG
jgi:hypothetical protein